MHNTCVYKANNLFIVRNKIGVQTCTGVSYFGVHVIHLGVQQLVARPVVHFFTAGFHTDILDYFHLLYSYLYPQSTEPTNNHNERKNKKGNN